MHPLAGGLRRSTAALIALTPPPPLRWRTACQDHRRRPQAAATARASPPGTCRTACPSRPTRALKRPGVVTEAPRPQPASSTCSAGPAASGPVSIRRAAERLHPGGGHHPIQILVLSWPSRCRSASLKSEREVGVAGGQFPRVRRRDTVIGRWHTSRGVGGRRRRWSVPEPVDDRCRLIWRFLL